MHNAMIFCDWHGLRQIQLTPFDKIEWTEMNMTRHNCAKLWFKCVRFKNINWTKWLLDDHIMTRMTVGEFFQGFPIGNFFEGSTLEIFSKGSPMIFYELLWLVFIHVRLQSQPINYREEGTATHIWNHPHCQIFTLQMCQKLQKNYQNLLYSDGNIIIASFLWMVFKTDPSQSITEKTATHICHRTHPQLKSANVPKTDQNFLYCDGNIIMAIIE